MDTVVRERLQIVHINSYNRISGTPYDYVVEFANGLIRLDGDGSIKLEPIQAVMNRSWYTVDDTNNNVQIEWSNPDGSDAMVLLVVIPTGFYNVKSFMDALSKALPIFVVGWEPIQSKYVFTPQDDGKIYKIVCTSWLCSLMGFELGTQYELSYNAPLKSALPIKMTHESVVLVHCDLAKSTNTAVDNFNSLLDMRESTIVVKIPIDKPPFDNLIWRSMSPGIVSFDLATTNITSLRVWLTDEFLRPLKVAYDWTMTLKFTIREGKNSGLSDANNMISLLSSIKDYLHYQVLSDETKNIKRSYRNKS
jgi:hypothetical protein